MRWNPSPQNNVVGVVSLILSVSVSVSRSRSTTSGFAARRASNKQGKKKKAATSQAGFGISKTLPSYYNVDSAEAIKHKRLLHFLEEECECEGLEGHTVGVDTTSGLRGVFAKEAFQPGDYLFAIPFVSTLLIDETFLEGDASTDEVRLSASRLETGVTFLQRFVQDDDKWNPYLDCLPMSTEDPNFDPTPDFWSDSEIRELQVPTLVKEMLTRKVEVEQKTSSSREQNNVDPQQLQHALWLVRTRAFTTLKKAMTLDGTEGMLQRTVLIPYMDFLNHDSQTFNAELQVIETKAYDESFYALVATRHISKGAELLIRYGAGDETSLELYSKYGFIPQGNEEKDKELLADLEVDWSNSSSSSSSSCTSLEEDQDEWKTATGTRKSILELRIYLKQILPVQ